jgi:hypothetical protein
MKEANFQRDLEWSQSWSAAPWWAEIYREAFPSMFSMRLVNEYGWAQLGGIDRIIGLADGTEITVDEKVRAEDWPDILLEIWSDADRRKPGWANLEKHLTCDFIAYAMVPSATCYLLPYQLLRRALVRHGPEWWANCTQGRYGFRFVDAPNRNGQWTYTTRSMAVPIAILLNAIRDAMVVVWQPAEAVTA